MYSKGIDYWERGVLLDNECVVVAGNTRPANDSVFVTLARVDSSGHRQWTHSYHSTHAHHDCIFGFAKTDDGFICGGNTEEGNDDYFIMELKTAVNTTHTVTNATTCGGADGQIIEHPFGGTPPYTYAWSPNVGSTATVSNLIAGAYNVTISDYDGLTKSEQVVITEPFTHSSSVRLYGMNWDGGANGAGVLYHYDSPNTLTLDYDFTDEYPLGDLILGSYNKLYGTCGSGGANEMGYIFSYDLNTGLNDLYDFEGYDIGGGTLIQATDGLLYGYGSGGDVDCNCGEIFSFDPSNNNFTNLYNITYSDNIGFNGKLLQANNGKFYGVGGGGNSGFGVIFTFDPLLHAITILHDFDSTHGSSPRYLFQASTDSLLYGMTLVGGPSNVGVMYSFNINNNNYTVLYNFVLNSHGIYPWGGLIQASNDSIYGMTSDGGIGYGNIFAYKIGDNANKNDRSFTSSGKYPCGTLLIASDGKMYGTTGANDGNNYGTIFQYNPSTTNLAYEITFNGSDINGASSTLIEVCVPSDIPTLSASSYSVPHNTTSTTLSVSGGNLNSGSAWHWYTGSCGGTAVSTGTSYSTTVTSGTTKFYVRGEGSCFSPCGCDSISIAGTRIAGTTIENSISSVNVYPNPANEEATIIFSSYNKEPYTIRLIDVMEREVFATTKTADIGNNQYLMSLSNIPKGIYMIFLQKGDEVSMSKIVIE